jgi:hypothetical protein
MRRTLAVLALSGLAATVVGSAATLTVDGNVIQEGSSTVACDTTGIDANWGLETDDNTVRSVRFSGVDAACVGAEMFVELYDAADSVIFKSDKVVTGAVNGESFSISAPYLTPASIERVRVWIEG